MLKGLAITFFLIMLTGFTPDHPAGVTGVVEHFKKESVRFADRLAELKSAITLIDGSDPQSVINCKATLTQCRLQYKRIAFFLEYFFNYVAVTYNAPAKVEVEEPSFEYNQPVGLQVIESLLFDGDLNADKPALEEQVDFLYSSAIDLNSLLHNFTASDAQILESLRLEIIRVISLTLTGFDAPLLKTGIQESFVSLTTVGEMLKPFLAVRTHGADNVIGFLNSARRYLEANPDFDSFDRLTFYTKNALPLQTALNDFIKARGLELNTTNSLNYNAPHLFTPDALRLESFQRSGPEPARVELGERLFFEKSLSGNRSRNCASCHDPALYFTDALPKSIAFDGVSTVDRNAPTLFYAAFQRSQFWDGRVSHLEEQIKDVLFSPVEMNADTSHMLTYLREDAWYRPAFMKAFPQTGVQDIDVDHIASAIAAFVGTLQPHDSPFDEYMKGDETAMTPAQQNGFNLFMGKAQCGTCHFAPLFNGLLPPLYQITEVEILGVPAADNLHDPVADTDPGRFDVVPIEYWKGAFKTPTVRNVAVTAPYMHNGAFGSLETVMDFYNQGGGAGLGLSIQHQTLSDQPLNLTESEISDIIEFMHALTDTSPGVQARSVNKQNTN